MFNNFLKHHLKCLCLGSASALIFLSINAFALSPYHPYSSIGVIPVSHIFSMPSGNSNRIYSDDKYRTDIEQKNCSSGMIDKCDWGECAAHREITKEN